MPKRFMMAWAFLLALAVLVFAGAEPDQEQLPRERDVGEVCTIADVEQAPVVLADVGACEHVPRAMNGNDQLCRQNESCVRSKHHDPG